MIIDAAQLDEGAALAADVCIVGSGAAGITLALELATTGLNVAMLTGGARRERSADRDLYRGEVEAGSSHEPLEENRRRAFGGSTIAWGGRCIPLEPIDFETRSWIPESGWPIAYSDLLPHFARAMAICDAGPFSFDARAPMIDGFDGPEITTKRLERWSPPTNFGRRYRRELDRARNVRVLMGAHALELELRADGGSIERVRAASRPGREFYDPGAGGRAGRRRPRERAPPAGLQRRARGGGGQSGGPRRPVLHVAPRRHRRDGPDRPARGGVPIRIRDRRRRRVLPAPVRADRIGAGRPRDRQRGGQSGPAGDQRRHPPRSAVLRGLPGEAVRRHGAASGTPRAAAGAVGGSRDATRALERGRSRISEVGRRGAARCSTALPGQAAPTDAPGRPRRRAASPLLPGRACSQRREPRHDRSRPRRLRRPAAARSWRVQRRGRAHRRRAASRHRGAVRRYADRKLGVRRAAHPGAGRGVAFGVQLTGPPPRARRG